MAEFRSRNESMSFIGNINRDSCTSLQSISWFSLFTVLVLPLFLFFSALLPAQTIDAPPNKTKELLQTTGDKTYIIIDDDKQLGELLRRIENPDFQLIRPPSPIIAEPGTSPITSKIQSLSFLGNMTGSVIQFQLQIQSEQFAEGDVWTDIGLNGILLQSVTENGLPIMASPTPQGNWMVRTQKSGLHNLNILFAVNIVFDRSSRRISCQIPEANNISLELRIPEKVLFASTGRNETLGLTYDRSKNEFLVKGKLPTRNRMDIRWLGQSLISGQPFQKMECRGMIGLNIDRDSMITRQQWLINRIEYMPETIKFSLPSNVSLNDVTLNGKASRPIFQTNSDNSTSITIPVSFSDELISTDLITLEITTRERYNQSENEDEKLISWSTPRWEEIQTISGVIALEYPEGYNLITPGSGHFNLIDPRSLPDKLRKSSISGAIEFHGDLERIPLKLIRRKTNLLVESQTIGIASTKRVEYVSELAIEGQPETAGVYEFHLPDTCQVLFIGPADVVQSYQMMPKSSDKNRDDYQINLNPSNKIQERNRIRIRYIQEINDEKSGLFAVPQFRNAIVRRNQALLLPESRSLKLVSQSQVINQINRNSNDYLELMPLLNRSFDELELIGRLQPGSSNPGIYTKATEKESINFSFQILTSKPEVFFRVEHEFQPDLKNPTIQSSYLFDKPEELPDILRFRISPNLVNRIHKVSSNHSGFQKAIKYSINEQNIEVRTEHSDERPYIIRFEINAEDWIITNDSISGILRMFNKFDPEMIVLDQGRCKETILIQKASHQFIPAFSSDQTSWQLMSKKSDEEASSDPTLKWKMRDPTLQRTVLSWIRINDPDNKRPRSILNDIHVIYDLSEYKKHTTLYRINQGVTQIELEKPANQTLISAEIPQKELIIYEKSQSYIIKWESTSRHFTLKTDWVHSASNIKMIQVAYPLSSEFDQQSTRTTISLLPRSGFYSFFLPLRYNLWKVSNDDLTISRDENRNDLITKIVKHSLNLNTFTKIGPIKIIELPKLLFFTVFIFLVSIILTVLWTYVNPTEFLFIFINVFILTQVLSAMDILSFTYIFLMVLSIPVTILMVFTQKLIFSPKQNSSLNDENNQIIACQPDIVSGDCPIQSEDSTVIRFNTNQNKSNESNSPSETRLVQPENQVAAGWNLSLDVNDTSEFSD